MDICPYFFKGKKYPVLLEQHHLDSKLNQNCSLKFTYQLIFPQTGFFE